MNTNNNLESQKGRWLPVFFYGCNILTWLVIGLLFRQFNFLWLLVFPIAAILLYIYSIRNKK
ncbi:MAG: hypothetical protein JXJ22_18130 [Bacteroidales bacterium]|nr:hypothetical protein [Bacteroidales bacterium]